jgi:hypothetical protein
MDLKIEKLLRIKLFSLFVTLKLEVYINYIKIFGYNHKIKIHKSDRSTLAKWELINLNCISTSKMIHFNTFDNFYSNDEKEAPFWETQTSHAYCIGEELYNWILIKFKC